MSTALRWSQVPTLQGGQNRVQKHVALDGPAGLDDPWPELFGQLGDILLKADTAAQVLVEHDVQPLAQVLPHDGNVWLGHPRQVRVDDPPLEGNVARAVEPLPQAAQGLQAGPEVGVAGQLDQPLGQVKSGVHARKLVGEDPGRTPAHARIRIVQSPLDRIDADSLIAQSPQGPGRGAPDDLGGIAQRAHKGRHRFGSSQPSQTGRGRGAREWLGIGEQSDDLTGESRSIACGHVPEVLQVIEFVYEGIGAWQVGPGRHHGCPTTSAASPSRLEGTPGPVP